MVHSQEGVSVPSDAGDGSSLNDLRRYHQITIPGPESWAGFFIPKLPKPACSFLHAEEENARLRGAETAEFRSGFGPTPHTKKEEE